jgi:hypothetical protein
MMHANIKLLIIKKRIEPTNYNAVPINYISSGSGSASNSPAIQASVSISTGNK